MTIEEKIGQMLVFGWMDGLPGDGRTVNRQARALVEKYKVGGIILMSRNVGAPAELRQLLQEMQHLALSNGLPRLFVSIDQEGGLVSRLRPPFYRQSRGAWSLGEENSVDVVRSELSEIGDELKDVGINWDFAPVLDVNNNPSNPVIGERSFGDNSAVVSKLGVAAIDGLQNVAHVMACGKHFPGHGDTSVDSHEALPTIEHSLEQLRTLELLPFQSAIAAGVAAIMTAHIMFPALDQSRPATLSKRVLTELLRNELGFRGLIVTDCLEMKGIADNWSFDQSAVLAVEAGADIVLCCHTLDSQDRIFKSLVDAVNAGRIPISRIEESLLRIRLAKERWIQPVGDDISIRCPDSPTGLSDR